MLSKRAFPSGKSRAFTLIELLVVIAIIAVLAAILFPVFAQARERARHSACLSNGRQLSLGVMQYAQDYDEALPPSTNYGAPDTAPDRIWCQAIQPYVKNEGIFTCPSAARSGFPTGWSMRGIGSIGYTAATATKLAGAAGEGFETPATLPMLDEPARIPLFGDTASGPTSDKYRGYVFDPCTGEPNAADPRLGTPLVSDRDLVRELNHLAPAQLKPLFARHFATGQNTGQVTLLLADGHVKTYSAASILAQAAGANLLWRFRGCN